MLGLKTQDLHTSDARHSTCDVVIQLVHLLSPDANRIGVEQLQPHKLSDTTGFKIVHVVASSS